MRTADDVIKEWEVIQSGRTRYEGQALRDDEIMLAEVLRLREEVEVLKEDIKNPIYCPSCGNCGEEGCCGIHRCLYPQDAPETIEEVLRLRAENADMRGELIDDWQEYLQDGSVNRDGWFHPYMTNARHSGLQLHKLGLVEKHPDREAYRFVKGGG